MHDHLADGLNLFEAACPRFVVCKMEPRQKERRQMSGR